MKQKALSGLAARIQGCNRFHGSPIGSTVATSRGGAPEVPKLAAAPMAALTFGRLHCAAELFHVKPGQVRQLSLTTGTSQCRADQ